MHLFHFIINDKSNTSMAGPLYTTTYIVNTQ